MKPRLELLRSVTWSIDFITGLCITGFTAGIANWRPDIKVSGTAILLGQGALGIAILGVVLTALSIVVAFMGDEYLAVLDRVSLGISGALFPYKVISVVCCALTIGGFVAALAWPLLPGSVQTGALASTSGLAAWAVVGIGQLVFLTAFHGVQRARLLQGIRDARTELARRRNSA